MKKGVVLITVSGIMITVTILAIVALNVMTVESRTAEHKLRRIRGYFAAQGAIVHALERLRREGTTVNTRNDIANDDPNIGGIPTDIEIAARGTTAAPDNWCPNASPSPFCVRARADY